MNTNAATTKRTAIITPSFDGLTPSYELAIRTEHHAGEAGGHISTIGTEIIGDFSSVSACRNWLNAETYRISGQFTQAIGSYARTPEFEAVITRSF